ncbi:MAG: InlB B-repeat-containing protein [Saccharofermentans sp.]|nr:InlB B-repeat-containing protein [Saccharofermentans sp.]
MVLIDRIKAMPKEKKIAFSVFAAIILIAIVVFIVLIARRGYLATTMRLLRVEGTVTIEDARGGVKPVIDNIRFQSGDALITGSDGLASVGLDDTKIVTLQNDSRAEFIKRRKQLELTLTKGGLFFEVTEHLDDDELMEIKTSNLTVGIRGTSGYVYYNEDGLQSLIITDGVVIVTAYNPVTGETKTCEVHGGEKITTYLYSDRNEERDSIEFDLVPVEGSELPEFPLAQIVANDELLNTVCAATGWDPDELRALASSILGIDGQPTPTPAAIIEITDTPTPTAKPTSTTTATPTPTDTPTPTPGSTATPTPKPSSTTAPDATSTPTPTPEPGAPTSTSTPTPAATATPTATPTVTATPTATPTVTPTPTTVPSYTVTFNANGHGTAPSAQTVEKGSTATEPEEPTAEGYEFGGWYKDSACRTSYNFSSAVTSNITLYAKWTALTYTVTFSNNGHGGTAPSNQTVKYGDSVEKPEDPSEEYLVFYGWYEDSACTKAYDFDSPVTSDIDLFAKWDVTVPSDLSSGEKLVWDIKYDEHYVYILVVPHPEGSTMFWDYYGYVDGRWVELYYDVYEDDDGSSYTIFYQLEDESDYYKVLGSSLIRESESITYTN